MKMVKSKLALGAAVAALALVGTSANAAVTWTSVGYDGPINGQSLVLDFDGVNAPGYIIAGDANTGVTSGTNTQHAAPAGDGTNYFYVMGTGAATLLAPTLLNNLSLYIGSLDDYNQVTFYSNGTQVGSYNGLQLQVPANGDQGAANTNRRFYFDFTSVGGVDQIVFESSKDSFEFDNVAVSAVPEPGVWALMIAGFGMLGTALRRRRSVAGVLA